MSLARATTLLPHEAGGPSDATQIRTLGVVEGAVKRAWEETLARACDGNEEAWVEVIRLIAGPVLGYFRLRGARDAEDLAAEVFTKIASSLRSFSGDEHGFRAWAFTIARRTLIDAHRRAQRRPDEVGLEGADFGVEAGTGRRRGSGDAAGIGAAASPESHVMQAFADAEMVQLLDQLTEDQREVLILRVVGGFTIAETAQLVEKHPNAVKQLQHRGLATLRRLLEGRGGDLSH